MDLQISCYYTNGRHGGVWSAPVPRNDSSAQRQRMAVDLYNGGKNLYQNERYYAREGWQMLNDWIK